MTEQKKHAWCLVYCYPESFDIQVFCHDCGIVDSADLQNEIAKQMRDVYSTLKKRFGNVMINHSALAVSPKTPICSKTTCPMCGIGIPIFCNGSEVEKI